METTKQTKQFNCDLCEKTYTSRQGLQHHKNTHLNDFIKNQPNSVKCKYCIQFFPKEKLREHYQAKHKPTKCDECEKHFYNKNSLYWHMKTHKEEYICDFCQRIFNSKVCLKSHLVDIHLKQKTRKKCEFCSKLIQTRNFGKHFREVHEKEFRLRCIVCKKGFPNATRLRDHLAFSHLKEAKYVCTICNKNLNSKSDLQIHMDGVHGAKPKTKCEKCEREFTLPGNYRRHMKSHLERPFSCTYPSCYSMMKTKTALEKHVKNNHTNRIACRKVVHKCDQCDKSYTTRHNLDLHTIKIHFGSKFKCAHCDKTCTDKYRLLKHILQNHFMNLKD